MKSLAHYQNKLRDHGFFDLILRRLRWYKLRLTMDNWYVGRMVELLGNRVMIEGVQLCVDNPLVTTRHKGSLFFGIYENAERDLAIRHLDRDLPTVELGGSIGGVACVVNALLKDRTSHVVLECNPILLPTLARNKTLNGANFSIEPLALAYGAEMVPFALSDHFMLSGIHGDGKTIEVRTTTLAAILEKYRFQTINLISDCEGAEIDLIENEPDLLRRHVRRLIIEIHEMTPGAIDRTIGKLCHLGFSEKERLRGGVAAFENNHLT